jgi:pilus assembly protein CpaC
MQCLILFLIGLLISLPAAANSFIYLTRGEAKPVVSPQEIDTVFIADPKIADYQVIDRHKIVVFGKSMGTTTLMAFDEKNHTVINRKLIVNQDLSEVVQQIRIYFPHAKVKVSNVGKQVVLSGTVSSEMEKDGIYNLVGRLLSKKVTEKHSLQWASGNSGNTSGGNGSSGGSGSGSSSNSGGSNGGNVVDFATKRRYQGIINQIEVAVTKQVNVKISVAEVSQNFLENFGIQYGDSGQSAGVFVNPLQNFSAGDLLATITAINDDTVGQVLAEPNLSVISGESASFLVGGEIPVVTVSNNGTNIQYKSYGIRLDMVAKVLRDDKIKLSLQPEVSSLDTQYTNSTYDLPALKTRRVKTSIELSSGQSFVLGGLLSSEDIEKLRKIPYAGDIPILGALFRHTETTRNKTELVIVATVNLVKPVSSRQIQLPSMHKTTNLARFFGLQAEYPPAVRQKASEILTSGGFKK